MIIYMRVQLRGGSEYIETIELNEVESKLFYQCSDNAWKLMCESIEARLGIQIIGNYNLVSYSCDGQIFKPLH
tara:strand:+ start:1981 stop:2199 length:219 start_codon:yes stop_codon:yes gene_type:complete